MNKEHKKEIESYRNKGVNPTSGLNSLFIKCVFVERAGSLHLFRAYSEFVPRDKAYTMLLLGVALTAGMFFGPSLLLHA